MTDRGETSFNNSNPNSPVSKGIDKDSDYGVVRANPPARPRDVQYSSSLRKKYFVH